MIFQRIGDETTLPQEIAEPFFVNGAPALPLANPGHDLARIAAASDPLLAQLWNDLFDDAKL